MVISLTSFPARLPHIAPCLESLVTQKGAEDCLVLWLGKEQFPHGMDDIPEIIRPFSASKGGPVDIRFTEDIRSFTKLLPALEAFPEDTIITVDDDVSYAPHTIDILKKAHAQNPTAIFAHAVSDLYRSHGEWRRTSGTHGFFTSPQPLRMMLGIGAVLYPPHALCDFVLDRQLFQKLCPTNDDIWFWYCAVRNGTQILKVRNALQDPLFLQDVGVVGGLSKVNESNGDSVNRSYLKNILTYDSSMSQTMSTVYRHHTYRLALAKLARFLCHYPSQAVRCYQSGGWRFLKTEIRRTIEAER